MNELVKTIIRLEEQLTIYMNKFGLNHELVRMTRKELELKYKRLKKAETP